MRVIQKEIADTYERNTTNDDLFSRKAVPLLTPEFYVIYTGNEEWNVDELRLSDSHIGNPSENSLELVVKVIDLRYNKIEAEEILSRSEKLRGYSLILKYIRENSQEGYALQSAIDMAIERCIEENILKDFLIKYGKEVRGMLYENITLERFGEIRAKEAGEEKWKEGQAYGSLSMQKKVNALTLKLIELNRMDDLKRASEDIDYQNQLFEEFGLIEN